MRAVCSGTPRLAAPSRNACHCASIAARERRRLIARRSVSACPAVKPASACATSSTWSWKTITPSVSAQRLLQQRVVVRHGERRVVADGLQALQEGVHRAALDRAGAHQRDLHHEVVEALRPRAQQHLHLRARLDLEDADGVRRLDLRVHLGVVERDAREVEVLARRPPELRHARLDRRQHPEPQQVDLQEARVGARVLVPLAERAPLHRRRLQRHEPVERAVRDDHAAGVLREVAGEARDLLRQGVEGAEAQVAGALRDARQLAQLLADVRGVPAVGRRGQPGDVARRQPQRLAELADGAARAVRREGADEAGLPRPVRLVHPHDQPLADVAREVEVDVGDARELLVEEAAEREAPLHGVDVREAREVADDGADARAAPAPRRQHVARRVRPAHLERDLAGQLQHLEVQQEEAREPVVGDERELLLQPARRLAPVRRRAPGSARRSACG